MGLENKGLKIKILKLKACNKKCGAGQPPAPHSPWIFCLALSATRAAGRRFWPDSAPKGVPHLPKLAALAILRSHSATAAGAGSPFPLMSGIGEEAATPGQPARVRTRLRNVPRRFTLENHRLLQALPQSSGKLRKLSRFRCSHSPSQPRPPQHKKSPCLCRNCGRKAFLVETRGKPSDSYEHLSGNEYKYLLGDSYKHLSSRAKRGT
jgi:hypothetical protein